jgi:hypothetical protein
MMIRIHSFVERKVTIRHRPESVQYILLVSRCRYVGFKVKLRTYVWNIPHSNPAWVNSHSEEHFVFPLSIQAGSSGYYNTVHISNNRWSGLTIFGALEKVSM